MQPELSASAAGRGRIVPWLFLPAAWAVLVGLALLLRPLTPVDETRYATVAWEMWQSGSWLVPQLHGLPYSDKPPLLFWLVLAGWSVLGVDDWWPRLVPPLFGLGSLFLLAALARRLWPERRAAAADAPVMLLGLLLWTVFSTFLMFDLLVAFFDLLALLGIVAAWRGRGDGSWAGRLAGWGLAGAALGLGVLAKGPIALLAPLSVAALAPWWGRGERDRRGWAGWYGGLAGALALAAAVALAWALPAAAAGGPGYAEAILLTQTEERIVHSFAHNRPWWWYLPLLPVLLAPYSLWPALWRSGWRLRRGGADLGIRFCLAWLVPPLAVLSLVSGKQPHYLLPLLPAAALLAARLLPAAPGAGARPRTWQAVPPLAFALLIGTAITVAPLFAGRFGLPGWLGDVRPLAGLLLLLATAALSLPLLPSGAGEAGPGADRRPLALTLLSVALVLTAHAGFAEAARREYDPAPLARYLRELEEQGRPIAYLGPYHGQFGYLGRLRRPLERINASEVEAWLRRHPDGKVVAERRQIPPNRTQFDYVQPYREDYLAVWGSRPGPFSAPSG